MDILKVYENIALSDKEVLKLIDGKANLILYPDLIQYDNIDEILAPYGACIILFEAKPKYGHWCCLFKQNEKLLEFFNPYGGYPDDSLEYIPMHFRLISNQYYPYLSSLMYKSPYELSYNEHKFQKHNKDIKTCGRHAAVRLVFRHLSLDKYKELLDFLRKILKMNYDEIVTLLTGYINKNVYN
jgi:mRNA-degrading endonuclease YafQ of YafQ-DinJ toxin-antitoxin module